MIPLASGLGGQIVRLTSDASHVKPSFRPDGQPSCRCTSSSRSGEARVPIRSCTMTHRRGASWWSVVVRRNSSVAELLHSADGTADLPHDGLLAVPEVLHF